MIARAFICSDDSFLVLTLSWIEGRFDVAFYLCLPAASVEVGAVSCVHSACDGLNGAATKLAQAGTGWRGGEVSSWTDGVLCGAGGPELHQLLVLKGDFEAQCFIPIILGFAACGDCCWIVPGFPPWVQRRLKTGIGVLLEKICHHMYLLEFEVTGCSLATDILTEVFGIYCWLLSSFNFVSLSFKQKIPVGENPMPLKSMAKLPPGSLRLEFHSYCGQSFPTVIK